MRFRLTAFALHLLGSAGALTLVLGGLYLGWYRWPGWYLTAVPRILLIVGVVDLGLGPTLTLIIANPRKPRAELTRDIAIIAGVQLVALLYGAATLWQGRPLYYTFSSDRLEMVQASDLSATEVQRARKENPSLAPYWYSRPRWVWAPLPTNPDEASHIVNSVILGKGEDIIDMPRYFKPWEQGVPALRERLERLDEVQFFSRADKQALSVRLQHLGLDPQARVLLVMWGGSHRLAAVFDPPSAKLRAIIKP